MKTKTTNFKALLKDLQHLEKIESEIQFLENTAAILADGKSKLSVNLFVNDDNWKESKREEEDTYKDYNPFSFHQSILGRLMGDMENSKEKKPKVSISTELKDTNGLAILAAMLSIKQSQKEFLISRVKTTGLNP